MTPHIRTKEGRDLAYHQTKGTGPGVVFLGGFRSDMSGTKALALEDWARGTGRPFLRFDYSGHGQSGGKFEDGTIGDWYKDAVSAISQLTEGPQVLVGSSMGGWISLLAAQTLGNHVAGLVTIAAAPDFTEDGMWASFSDEQRNQMDKTGRVLLPSDYSEDHSIITRQLIEDGRKHLVLRKPLHLPFPVRFLQGTADADVPMAVATRLLDHAEGPDMRLTLVKDADHRFSTPTCLEVILWSIEDVLDRIQHA